MDLLQPLVLSLHFHGVGRETRAEESSLQYSTKGRTFVRGKNEYIQIKQCGTDSQIHPEGASALTPAL